MNAEAVTRIFRVAEIIVGGPDPKVDIHWAPIAAHKLARATPIAILVELGLIEVPVRIES